MAITLTLEMLVAVRQTPGSTKLTPPLPPVANSVTVMAIASSDCRRPV